MKTLKLATVAAVLLSSAGFSTTVAAEGSFSANVGYVSQYHFRGIQQTDSGSASVGLDYENGGFYVGTWAADVKDGLEIDFYGGYGVEFDNGFSLGAGLTTYQYTGDFDSEYNELNLSAGIGVLSLEVSLGTHEEDLGLGITESDYSFVGVSLEHNGFSATIGSWGKDFEGEYVEVGYGTEVGGFDVGVGAIFSGSDLDDDEALYFSVSKSFDL